MTPYEWIVFAIGFTICFGFAIAALSIALVALAATR